MNIEQTERLRILLHNEDIKNVRMGLELCDALLLEASAVVDLFCLKGISDSKRLSESQKAYPHGRHLYGWILCKLLELGVSWVTELKSLDLRGCGLSALPEHVLQHRSLEGIDLSFNALNVPPDLSGLSRLKWLHLFGNPLNIPTILPTLDAIGLDVEDCLLSVSDVPSGRFIMGALLKDELAWAWETPRHEVVISKDMRVMRLPVTQWLYELVMGHNPSEFQGLDRPVETVSWYDAVSFANALSIRFDLSPAYEINGASVVCHFQSNGWRLPTEAEREYLARGGESHLFAGNDDVDSVAWYSDNSGGESAAVGDKTANAFGLYDMSGNVNEWCWDWFGDYSSDSETDPQGPSRGSNRVIRGGSWFHAASLSRSSFRHGRDPSLSYSDVGFRLVRSSN